MNRLVLSVAVLLLTACDPLVPIRVDCVDVSDEVCAEVSDYVERFFKRRGEVVHNMHIRPTGFTECGLHAAIDFDVPLYDVLVRLEGQSSLLPVTLSRTTLDPSENADLAMCSSPT